MASCAATESPQRTKSTPVGVQHLQNCQGWQWFYTGARGCLKSWLLFRHPREFKIKSLYSNDLILNIASKSKETVQKLKFSDSPSSLSSCTRMYNCLTVYFKRLTEGPFSERTGMSVVPLRSDVFALCTNLVGRTPKDGRGISQKQVLEQNLSSTDVHGRTSVERYTDVHFWTVYFKRLTENVFSKAVEVCASTSCCTK